MTIKCVVKGCNNVYVKGVSLHIFIIIYKESININVFLICTYFSNIYIFQYISTSIYFVKHTMLWKISCILL